MIFVKHTSAVLWIQTTIILTIWALVFDVIVSIDTSYPEVKQYCQFETFNATCPPNHTVVMETAYYGRKQKGRCGNSFLGCSLDVIDHLEWKCSGRRSCIFDIPDSTLRAKQPCANALKNYLEASYSCLEVQQGDTKICATPIPIRAHSEGYIASDVTATTGRGSDKCPWLLTTRNGQQLNITLYDYTYVRDGLNEVVRDSGGTGSANPGYYPPNSRCEKYAVIEEDLIPRKTVVCQGRHRRRVLAHRSTTNSVKIAITSNAEWSFLLHYQPIGCATPARPLQGWMVRVGEHVDAGCNGTEGDIWRMQCISNTWHITEGTPNHNCTMPPNGDTDDLWHILSEDWSSPFGILVVSALGVALGLVIGISLLLLVLLVIKKRHMSCLNGHSEYAATEPDSEDTTGYILHAKADADGNVTDRLELVNLQEHAAAYGAMWRSRPPSYNVNNSSAEHAASNEPHLGRLTKPMASVPNSQVVQSSPRMTPPELVGEGGQPIPMSPAPDLTIGTNCNLESTKRNLSGALVGGVPAIGGVGGGVITVGGGVEREKEPLHSTFRPALTNHSISHPSPQPTTRIQADSADHGHLISHATDQRVLDPHVYESPKFIKRNQSAGTLSAHAHGNI